jgi:hypothetical protein
MRIFSTTNFLGSANYNLRSTQNPNRDKHSTLPYANNPHFGTTPPGSPGSVTTLGSDGEQETTKDAIQSFHKKRRTKHTHPDPNCTHPGSGWMRAEKIRQTTIDLFKKRRKEKGIPVNASDTDLRKWVDQADKTWRNHRGREKTVARSGDPTLTPQQVNSAATRKYQKAQAERLRISTKELRQRYTQNSLIKKAEECGKTVQEIKQDEHDVLRQRGLQILKALPSEILDSIFKRVRDPETNRLPYIQKQMLKIVQGYMTQTNQEPITQAQFEAGIAALRQERLNSAASSTSEQTGRMPGESTNSFFINSAYNHPTGYYQDQPFNYSGFPSGNLQDMVASSLPERIPVPPATSTPEQFYSYYNPATGKPGQMSYRPK